MTWYVGVRRRLLAVWWALTAKKYLVIARKGEFVVYAVSGGFLVDDAKQAMDWIIVDDVVADLLDGAGAGQVERS